MARRRRPCVLSSHGAFNLPRRALPVLRPSCARVSQVRFASIQSQLAPFLASCGFRDAAVQWLPAVGPAGENLARPPSAACGLAQWWQGPTLVQAIDGFAPRERLTGE